MRRSNYRHTVREVHRRAGRSLSRTMCGPKGSITNRAPGAPLT
jgi:hypothetical protein